MKLTFENLGTNTYLVYEINETDELDSMSLGMLTNNNIPGFAPASFTQMDATKYIKYNVSAKVSVNQLFSGPVNKKRLLGVFSGVVDAMLSAEDYMLDPGSILLDKDYIFADVTTCETELVCLPVLNLQQEKQDIAAFFKNILFTTQFDQTENCDHVAKLINYLNTSPVLVLADFKELLHSIVNPNAVQPAVEVKPVQPVQPLVQPVAQPAVQPTVQPTVQPAVVQPVVQPAQRSVPVQQPVKPETPPVARNVPPIPSAQPAQPAQPATNGDEKPMTLMYLMQHYNKENVAIYKAQQEAAKAKGAAPAPVKAAPAKTVAPGFAVPGQSNPGVNIPGQAVPQPAKPAQKGNAGFAVPGQAPAKQVVPQPAPKPVSQPAPVPAPAKAGVCPKCGNPVAPNQMFCASCGTRCGAAAAPVQPTPVPVTPVAPVPVQTPVAPQPVQGSALNFGETTVLSAAIGETTVLSGATETVKNEPHLIRTKNNEKIPLSKPVFRVGKERSYVDYFIGDNTAVSRSHANIINHDGEFFVVDTNSTNHTYVNGGMIQSGVETKLSHGTKIKFANEEFEFKMY